MVHITVPTITVMLDKDVVIVCDEKLTTTFFKIQSLSLPHFSLTIRFCKNMNMVKINKKKC